MLRFVPIENSLEDNAPGYNSITSETKGPSCWKCSGSGVIQNTTKACKVCKGRKYIQPKVKAVSAGEIVGTVRKRMLPPNWMPSGPPAFYENAPDEELSSPLQPQIGEQLCFLVGNWRIFQRVGGHRWTTDDLVTAWVAGQFSRTRRAMVKRTLDLGCGNGSVLMMVAWQYPEATCMGLEAREEAVALARRSILYNCGPETAARVTVHNVDFRSLCVPSHRDPSSNILQEAVCDSESMLFDSRSSPDTNALPLSLHSGEPFDLITGTPPYFRVDFEVNKSPPQNSLSDSKDEKWGLAGTTYGDEKQEQDNEGVTKAVVGAYIRQGGMPTCKESAPARCEFRGGIEAYCAAAACALALDGVFVVCENWASHERVLLAAPLAGLQIVSVQRVIGRMGKPPLFAVYTMVLSQSPCLRADETSCSDDKPATEESVQQSIGSNDSILLPTDCARLVKYTAGQDGVSYATDLIVRDTDGAWTLQYADVLRGMSYPVTSLHPSGRY